MRSANLALRAALIAIVATVGFVGLSRRAAFAADADGLNLEPHPGPEVWFEEHWAVIPEKLQEFLATYDKEVYSIARRTPGYRGYTVVTSLPPGPSENQPAPTARLGGGERFISGHPGIWLNGEVLTERGIDFGYLLGKTYNVIIVHHEQSWADAEKFPYAFDKIYADEHNGEDVNEHLSKVLYPLVTNEWSEYYRLVKTGFPSTPPFTSAKPASSTDADGLNLEPHAGPLVVIEEHWDVKPENLHAFLDAYEREVYTVIRKVPGYRGYSTFTSLPPDKGDPQIPLQLGGSDDLLVFKQGMLMGGDKRTDKSINAGALFRHTFNVKIFHYMQTWADSDAFVTNFNKIYADSHNGVLPWSRWGWTQSLMPLGKNHWDMYYRVVKTSFVPTAPGASVHK